MTSDPSRPVARCLAPGIPACLVALLLVACGGSNGTSGEASGDIGTLPTPQAPADASPLSGPLDPAPADVVVETGGAGLVFVTEGACGAAGDEITARLVLADGVADGEEQDAAVSGEQGTQSDAGTNVTAFASFDQGLGDSIELVSRTDESIVFRMNRPDIVALTATVPGADGTVATLTNYFGAWPADAPADAVLKKPAPAGCLWSVRLGEPDSGFCASVYSRGGAGRLGVPGQRLEVSGCESINASGLPITELDAVEAGAGS